MARDGASPHGAASAMSIAVHALLETSARRGGVDRPSLYDSGDNPWTDQFARAVLSGVEPVARAEAGSACHEIAANWRFPALLPDGPVIAGGAPLYDLAWRVYTADCAALIDQPLVAECVWRGGWRSLAGAADRLAQARAGLGVLCASDDPDRDVGGMSLLDACAYRWAAFARPGAGLLLAFYRTADGRFELFFHEAGRGAPSRVNPAAGGEL